jgi:hypothetical protein
MAHPMWESISTIFSMEEDSRRMDVTRFSTPRTTPSEVQTPMAVDPSWRLEGIFLPFWRDYFDCFDGIFNLK